MSYCGISVTNDLAAIAAVEDSRADILLPSGQPVVVELFTFSDGRAFPRCPYFGHWKATKQFILSDGDQEEIDFGRALVDFRDQWGCCAIGFNRDQLLVADPCALAIKKDGAPVEAALRELNRHATRAERPGYLFPPNTALQFMWASLPLLDGARVLPSTGRVASGRTDGIRAILNAMCTAAHFEQLAKGVA
jgi:hypothetical protein